MFPGAGMLASLVLALLPIAVVAQDDTVALETIVVTGSRVTYRDLLETPAVSLTRRGDSLRQPFTLHNDSRNADTRRDEIHATIKDMMRRAGDRYRIVYPENFVGALDDSNYRVEIASDEDRPDAGFVELAVDVALEGRSESGERLIRDLRAFIESIEGEGRTEIELGEETALSLVRPERFRHELIAAIAADTAKVRAALGAGCKVQLDGMNSRIEWERVSALQLVLYIPYQMSVMDCG
jgi:hypothetical protein